MSTELIKGVDRINKNMTVNAIMAWETLWLIFKEEEIAPSVITDMERFEIKLSVSEESDGGRKRA